MNHFNTGSIAERYAKGRPNFHPNTIARIENFLQLSHQFDKALDIACGTGLSTQALLPIAKQVYGTDISQPMLDFAAESHKIEYKVSPAESQPFPDHEFDLITVGSGVHWFDIDKFLLEANRLLRKESWLVLYENHFIAEMEGKPELHDWFYSVYLKRYPSPPRNNQYNWSNENLGKKGFTLVKELRFNNAVQFNKQKLILYFTTQSNVISAVEKKKHPSSRQKPGWEKHLPLFSMMMK
ncbi:MAG TPA: class I SAM-dependent methyltransferase [Chitinophagaceae bacterium]|nr:class I SAM-dependent methyltransferase [Chitinophagaceae bacterium]